MAGGPSREYEVFHDTFEFIYSSFEFADILAASGMPTTPESAIKWSGDASKIESKPRQPRDHSSWTRSKRATPHPVSGQRQTRARTRQARCLMTPVAPAPSSCYGRKCAHNRSVSAHRSLARGWG